MGLVTVSCQIINMTLNNSQVFFFLSCCARHASRFMILIAVLRHFNCAVCLCRLFRPMSRCIEEKLHQCHLCLHYSQTKVVLPHFPGIFVKLVSNSVGLQLRSCKTKPNVSVKADRLSTAQRNQHFRVSVFTMFL